MSAASNTNECFREVIGRKVIAVLFNAIPVERRAIATEAKTLIFDDLTGLTIAADGAFWRESAADIRRGIDRRRDELTRLHSELSEVLAADGLLASMREGEQ